MSQEILTKTMALFDTPEKWNSYQELVSLNNKMHDAWYSRLKEAMTRHFSTSGSMEKWDFKFWGALDSRWYLKEFGWDSVCLYLYGTNFHLWVHNGNHDGAKVAELLKSPQFNPLLMARSYNRVYVDPTWQAAEDSNWSFGSSNDGRLSQMQLAWYAGNQTEQLLEQIIEKVDSYRRNEALTNLLFELNKLTKR